MSAQENNYANPVLYRLYFSLICEDILRQIDCESTKENKKILHEFNKMVLKRKSIAGMSQEELSLFLFEVGVFWSQLGIFVRTKSDQPENLIDLNLSDIWNLL